MPGNRTVFNDAVTKGHNAAWDGQWAKAVTEYRRALAEFPNDVPIRLSLAHALEQLGQWESALREYRHLVQAQPQDPAPLTRVAVVLDKLQRHAEAASVYLQLAEMYAAQQSLAQAIEAWRKAAELEPERTDVHQKLIEAYKRSGQFAAAAHEYLALAKIHRARGDRVKAQQLAEQALQVSPHDQTIRAFLDELVPREPAPTTTTLSPVDAAEKTALARLAETLLDAHEMPAEEERRQVARSGIDQAEVDALIARAVDAQMRHRVHDAIDAYRTLMAQGVTRPEIKFNLGLLYFETMRYDEAIHLLAETVNDPHYTLASHYALGQCYRAQGKIERALEHFLQVVKIVDLSSVRRDQVDDLIRVYEELAESYAVQGNRAQAEEFSRALEEFLSSKGWEDKVQQFRQRIETIKEEGEQISLAQALEVHQADRVLEALAFAHEYLRREKFDAASEECMYAIELAPTYLPAHIRLAEILVKQNRLSEANAKYQTLAELCTIQGDFKRAEAMYRNALKIVPEDVSARAKLIDLLVQQQRIEEAVEQYLELGESFARVNQIGKAAEKFAEGLRVANRAGYRRKTVLTLQHRLAEIRTRQNDFAGALSVYQDIHQHSPEDERAHFYIVDLELRLGQTSAALRDLEALLTRYQKRNEPKKIADVLEALIQSYPAEIALTKRLAEHYCAQGEVERAVALLDALGETQLSLGNKRAAAEIIRHIIALNPPQVEEYKKLLQQIGR